MAPLRSPAVPAVVSRLDWHNARARLLIDINAALEAAHDNEAREAILHRLAQALRAPPSTGG